MTHPVGSLTAYLDGALDPAERAEVDSHLAACASCRAERDRLAAAVALLARLPPPPSPAPGFEQRFYGRLASEKAEAREQRGFLDRIAALSRPREAGERVGEKGLSRSAWRWFAPGLAGVAATVGVLLYTGAQHRKDEAFVAEHLDLFESYEAVASVDAVDGAEDVQVVAHLQELRVKP